MLIFKKKLLLNSGILSEPLQNKYTIKKKKEIQDQLKSVEVLLQISKTAFYKSLEKQKDLA